MNVAFMKTFGQAMEYGYEVTEVLRDECPHPRAKMRVDVGMRINPRLHFFEAQISKMDYFRWHGRLAAYIRLYELLREPFRSNWLLVDQPTITKARRYAKELLIRRRHANLNLFNFITLGDFRAERDVIKGSIWQPVFGDGKVALM